MGTSTVTLKAAIDRGGFYPSLVHHTVTEALDGREPEQQIVHVDTHFDFEEVHRHITVLVLAEDVMVVAHLDDHDADEDRPFQHEDSGPSGSSEVVARISTEVVPVVRLRSLILSEVHRSRTTGTTSVEIRATTSEEPEGPESSWWNGRSSSAS